MPDEPILREMARQFDDPDAHRLRPRDGREVRVFPLHAQGDLRAARGLPTPADGVDPGGNPTSEHCRAPAGPLLFPPVGAGPAPTPTGDAWRNRIRHYIGMAREEQKLAGLFRDIKFTTIRDVLAI